MVLQLEATGARILEMDFRDEASIQKAAANYGEAPLDCLVNCAGKSIFKNIFIFEEQA